MFVVDDDLACGVGILADSASVQDVYLRKFGVWTRAVRVSVVNGVKTLLRRSVVAREARSVAVGVVVVYVTVIVVYVELMWSLVRRGFYS